MSGWTSCHWSDDTNETGIIQHSRFIGGSCIFPHPHMWEVCNRKFAILWGAFMCPDCSTVNRKGGFLISYIQNNDTDTCLRCSHMFLMRILCSHTGINLNLVKEISVLADVHISEFIPLCPQTQDVTLGIRASCLASFTISGAKRRPGVNTQYKQLTLKC